MNSPPTEIPSYLLGPPPPHSLRDVGLCLRDAWLGLALAKTHGNVPLSSCLHSDPCEFSGLTFLVQAVVFPCGVPRGPIFIPTPPSPYPHPGPFPGLSPGKVASLDTLAYVLLRAEHSLTPQMWLFSLSLS